MAETPTSRLNDMTRGKSVRPGTRRRPAVALALLTIIAVVAASTSLPAFAQREQDAGAQPSATIVDVQAADHDDAAEHQHAADEDAGFHHVHVDGEMDFDFTPPEPPELPDLPELPELPELHGLPDAPELAELPDLPDGLFPPDAPLPMHAPSPMIARPPMHAPPAMPARPPMHAPLPMKAPAPPLLLDLDLSDVVAPALDTLDFELDLDVDEGLSRERADENHDARQSAKAGERRTGRQLTVDELIALRTRGVTPEYIDEMRSLFPDASLSQVASMRVHGVTSEYVRDIRGAGLPVTTAREAQSLAVSGVSASYISDLRAAGVTVTSSRDAARLRHAGVTPAFVKQLSAAGYSPLTVRELTRLSAAGINAGFIGDLEKYKNKKQ